MPGANGATMVLTPEVLQQLSQGGGLGLSQIAVPQGMGLPQGISGLPPIGMIPSTGLGNLPPGVGIITPQTLNNMPPQQKQIFLQAISGMMPLGMSGMGGFGVKKDE